MSHIPAKAMHHAQAAPDAFDAESGKLAIVPAPAPVERGQPPSWLLGAIGAGLAVGAVAAIFALRSSSARRPAPRRKPGRPKGSTTRKRRQASSSTSQ